MQILENPLTTLNARKNYNPLKKVEILVRIQAEQIDVL